jgi:uncharacterized membrane protein YhaH (DUF805 family)
LIALKHGHATSLEDQLIVLALVFLLFTTALLALAIVVRPLRDITRVPDPDDRKPPP